MTYSINVSGSMQNLEDEANIQEAAMDLVGRLSGVQSAMLSTTNGGSVNLLEPAGATNGETAPAPPSEPAPGATVEGVAPVGPAETVDEASE